MRFLALAAAMLLAPLKAVDAYAVFAHFMITNTASWGVPDWASDMRAAQAMSIDAFAINMAVGDPANSQIGNALAAGAITGFKIFFSFDYGGNGPWPQQTVLDTLTPWMGNVAYYKLNGKPFVSTFAGAANHADWVHIKAVTGCYFIPDWSSVSAKEAWSYGQADGLFSWAAWPVGPRSMDTFPDASYLLFMGADMGNRPVAKNYMMPVSPWFYTNLPGYNKNWLWNGDTLWFDRWEQVFYTRPDFVEIISWNDYGESHYIGPLHSESFDAFTIGKASYNYADGMPHTGWTIFLPYLIQTYKTGKATIQQELLSVWFRLTPAAACGDGGTTGNVANQLQIEYPPSQIVQDRIYFAALLSAEVAPKVSVGGNVLQAQWDRKPQGGVGIYRGSAAYGSYLGTVEVTVNGMYVGSQSITTVCRNGVSNFNAWVGSATGPTVNVAPSWGIYDNNVNCTAGTSVGDFAGLCSFGCNYGYCPIGSCICVEMGIPPPKPKPSPTLGYPGPGKDASYAGLCANDCTYGYCPSPACDTAQHPLTTPTSSPFNPNVCTKGSAKSDPNLGGLCSFACAFGMCPMHVCNCDSTGTQPVLPAYTASAVGMAAPGVTDGGLCSWSCPYGYCPSGACNHGSAPSAPTGTIPAQDCTSPRKIVGYYIGTAAKRGCLPWAPDASDSSTFTHIIYGFFAVGPDGSVTSTADQTAGFSTARNMKKLEPNIKIMIGIGGFGFGADPSGFLSMAQNSGTQQIFASNVAALAKSISADGVDIEWPMCNGLCVSADQFANLVAFTKASVGNLIVSVHLPNGFFALSGLGPSLGSIASHVDFISLITTYAANNNNDPNDMNTIPQNMKTAMAANSKIPSSLFLFGIPFFSRPTTSSLLQSSCLSANDLGQGTYPYYAFDALVNDYVYDSNAWSVHATSPDVYLQSLYLSDGSFMFGETTYSVATRASQANGLCMGGVSAFSIDQDSIDSDLANGIFALGGYLPTADVVVSSIGVPNSIDGNGYLSSGAYDTFASNLVSQYPFLTAADSYRTLLLGALALQTQISNHLASYLSAPELSTDNFAIYKKWTGKAINFEIASATGGGNQYWSCASGLGVSIRCPGFIDLNETPANPSPHITTLSTVVWTLKDPNGFKTYLSNSLGLNLDNLVSGGSFDVSRDQASCGGGGNPVCHPSCTREEGELYNATVSNSTGSHYNQLAKRAGYDPLNLPACHTTWQGLYLIDPNTFFSNPKDSINGYIASTADSVNTLSNYALEPMTEPIQLMSLLQMTLTAISVGNQTISNTLSYINQTRLDEQEQAAYEAATRHSIQSLIETIAMVVLAFIPGVGEIVDLVTGGFDLATAISGVADIASLTKNLEGLDALAWIGRLGSDADVAGAVAKVENALDSSSLLGRFRFGQSAERVQGNLLQCAESNLGSFLLNTADFGTSLASLPVARRAFDEQRSLNSTSSGSVWANRSLADTTPRFASNDSYVQELEARHWEQLDRRAGAACVWQVKAASDLKISSTTYRALCKAGNLNMEYPNSFLSPTSTTTVDWNTCVSNAGKADEGKCQCDHLFEPNEFTKTLGALSKAEKADLCKLSIFDTSTSAITKVLNDKSNFCGLWGDVDKGANFNPNSVKSALLQSFGDEKALKSAYKKYTDAGRKLMYSVADDHIQRFKTERATTGDNIDTLLHTWRATVEASGSDSQKAAFKKIYAPNADGTKRSTYKAAADANTARSAKTLGKLKANDAAVNKPAPAADGSTSTGGKSTPKAPKNGSGDGSTASTGSGNSNACGSSSTKLGKRKRSP